MNYIAKEIAKFHDNNVFDKKKENHNNNKTKKVNIKTLQRN